MAGEDFVQVRMSAAGEAFAGKDGVIAVQNSRSHFHFKAGESQRVVKSYEWGYLATQMCNGEPLFELVDAPGNPSKQAVAVDHEVEHPEANLQEQS